MPSALTRGKAAAAAQSLERNANMRHFVAFIDSTQGNYKTSKEAILAALEYFRSNVPVASGKASWGFKTISALLDSHCKAMIEKFQRGNARFAFITDGSVTLPQKFLDRIQYSRVTRRTGPGSVEVDLTADHDTIASAVEDSDFEVDLSATSEDGSFVSKSPTPRPARRSARRPTSKKRKAVQSIQISNQAVISNAQVQYPTPTQSTSLLSPTIERPVYTAVSPPANIDHTLADDSSSALTSIAEGSVEGSNARESPRRKIARFHSLQQPTNRSLTPEVQSAPVGHATFFDVILQDQNPLTELHQVQDEPQSHIPQSQCLPIAENSGPNIMPFKKIAASMDDIFYDIRQAVSCFFSRNGSSTDHSNPYVLKPDAELKTLYIQILNEDWLDQAMDLHGRFSNEHMLMALLGAAVCRVFTDRLPFPTPDEILNPVLILYGALLESRDPNWRAGQLHLLREAAIVGLGDKAFLDEMINPVAVEHAQQTTAALMPHLRQVTLRHIVGERQQLQERLEHVFQKAIILKAQLQFSDAKYRFFWHNSDAPYVCGEMAELHSRTHNNQEVVFTVFPGIFKCEISGRDDQVVSKAHVVLRECEMAEQAPPDQDMLKAGTAEHDAVNIDAHNHHNKVD